MKMKRATTENNTAVYGNIIVSYILTYLSVGNT